MHMFSFAYRCYLEASSARRVLETSAVNASFSLAASPRSSVTACKLLPRLTRLVVIFRCLDPTMAAEYGRPPWFKPFILLIIGFVSSFSLRIFKEEYGRPLWFPRNFLRASWFVSSVLIFKTRIFITSLRLNGLQAALKRT